MITPQTRYFLQSQEWATFQKTLGHKVYSKSGNGWEYVAILERGYGRLGKYFKRLYLPYGPTADSMVSMHTALDSLERLAKKVGVDYVRIEPVLLQQDNTGLVIDGYHKIRRSFQPEQTLVIDLHESMDVVLHKMSKTNRYLWNKAERNGLSFKVSYEPKSLDHFLAMMDETSERTNARFKANVYYEALLETLGQSKTTGVAYAYHDNTPLVGVLFADDHVAKTRYYLYAGSFDAARKHSANAPLVVFLLEDAKKKGIQAFDFFGVAPAGATNHRWAGFSKFKRSFGGDELVFAGTFEKPIHFARYWAMSTLRKFAKK